MAKLSLINREKKRELLRERYAEKRKALVKVLADFQASGDNKFQARLALQQLPRNSSPVRQRRRCGLTGRPRGVYRKFGLARGKLRELVMNGKISGVTKASW